MKMLSQLLPEPSNHTHKVSRTDVAGGKRGLSVSSEASGGGGGGGAGQVEREGVILEPTSVDLVGRCGPSG